MFILMKLVILLSTFIVVVRSLPGRGGDIGKPQALEQSTDRLVFAHFMIGITSNRRNAADYDDDMVQAKSLGIDAFALNIGVDPYTDQQLQFAYASAAKNNMKVFLSFDFNWWHTPQVHEIGQKIAQYGLLPGQLMVDGKIFVSTFAGDDLDVATLRKSVGKPIFFAPNFHPSYGTNISAVDGLLNWMAWPNDGNNKAPTARKNVSVADGDHEYLKALNGKAYIAPASPWFFTHFGPEVPYSKNWVFPSDLLWYDRWNEILAMKPRFVEIVTWNDYGESHYIGPLRSPHTDDGASKWINDMPHEGWLELSKPFIAAFKAGATSVNKYIDEDLLIYWYRPTLRDTNCDSTDTCMVPANNDSGNYFLGRPNGWETMQDSVFVVSLLTAPALIQIDSGGTLFSYNAPAGALAQAIPMHIGTQSFSMIRHGKAILSGSSLKPIISECVCGLYNFNAFVGTLPPGPRDALQPDGLAAFRQGLRVSTCEASPSLGTVPPPTAPVTSSTTIPATTTTTSKEPTTTTTATTTTTTTTATKPCMTSTACTATVTITMQLSTILTTTEVSVMTITQTETQRQTVTATATTCSTGGAGGDGGSPTDKACIAGTGPDNYSGLCVFACKYGYCPPGPCTCTQYGTALPPPPSTGVRGVPLAGEDDSYLGLCSFACDHGYCPSTACRTA
ncbi:putative alpha-1,3-glucanase [Penicillium oxalicum 114-2]|uniref:Putative alpha-1,3-glucanase n=1 Tax=Penicillium oxalicum (strain 114-2 / CGMCC 5302) TaxID=933388 RepID=S7ZMT6_PENO1|nr:putative alpha-1,3-glucanase [Penicillium oxalicum 114-2]